MEFYDALKIMYKGERVTREKWSGDKYIYLRSANLYNECNEKVDNQFSEFVDADDWMVYTSYGTINKWKILGRAETGGMICTCTECEEIFKFSVNKPFKYCPNCGKDMRL